MANGAPTIPPQSFLAALGVESADRGRTRRALWAGGVPEILAYARQQRLALRPQECAALEHLVAVDAAGVPVQAERLANELLTRERSAKEQFGEQRLWTGTTQAAQQIAALGHGILAAVDLQSWSPDRPDTDSESERLPESFVQHAAVCLALYRQAWPVRSPRLAANDLGQRAGFQESQTDDRATLALRRLLKHHRAQIPANVTIADLLLLRRLLRYLRSEDDALRRRDPRPGEPFQVDVTLLAALSEDDGQRLPGHVVSEPGPWDAYFLDPVVFGLRLLDDEFLQSLDLGWRYCRSALRQDRLPTQPPLTLRIGIDVPPAMLFLEGDSAGGVLACAMFAAAHRTPLNTADGASFAIRLKPEAAAKASTDDDLFDADIELCPVGTPTILAKIQAAADATTRQSGAPCRRVVLAASQGCGGSRERPRICEWNEWIPDARARHEQLTIRGVSSFAAAFNELTGDARVERVLDRYGKACADEWDRRRNDDDDPDFLKHYIDPHFSVKLTPGELKEKSQREVEQRRKATAGAEQGGAAAEDRYRPVAEAGEDGETELIKLLRLSRRVCVTEDAGAGKTVFTRRLLAFLGTPRARDELFEGRTCLAVRFEHRVDHWPEDFKAELKSRLCEAVAPYISTSGVEAADVAEWALSRGRVVLILDALDQVETPSSVKTLQEFLTAQDRLPESQRCRVLLTGRAWVANAERDKLFRSSDWRYVRIEPFDLEQQYRYLQDLLPNPTPTPPSWIKVRNRDDGVRRAGIASLTGRYGHVADLLRIPVVLGLIRELARHGELHPFQTRGELYLQVHDRLTKRAADKLDVTNTPARRMRWRVILAAVAFEMMTRKAWDYTVSGDAAIESLKRRAGKRCIPEVTEAEWTEIEQVTDLTNRALLENARRDLFGFKHKGMMEFYCGLHLAGNGQPGWSQYEKRDDGTIARVRCGDLDLSQFSNDDNWHWAWRFAIELPGDERHSDDQLCLAASLPELFRLPRSGLRPTELMYLALPYFEGDDCRLRDFGWTDRQGRPLEGDALIQEWRRRSIKLPGADGVMAEFRGEFERWQAMPSEARLAGFSRSPGDVARELVCPPDERPDGAKYGFVECPPKEWRDPADPNADPCVFQMGSPEGEADRSTDEVPHQVRLTPFQMQSTAVTREQYRLFDPQLEIVHSDEFTQYAPDETCPAIETNWFDGYLFARWLGPRYRLPTEAEWEYGCRAGTKTATAFGDSLGSVAANFDGKHPYNGARKGKDKGKTTPVGSYAPNGWQIFDMHGNVWEWTWDWYAEYAIEASGPVRDPHSPSGQASFRVNRGGGWFSLGGGCRSANRHWNAPGFRSIDLGFRVAAVR